ncbi:MAG: hypothetical protein Q7V53_00545 [Caldisericota bacterium]|nr:hypothetical protein [Caldisericota bacterium]
MEDLGWDALLRVPANEAEHETESACGLGTCPCSCLRNMVPVLDADSPESAILEAQSALGAVTGAVVLSAYRTVPDEQCLALVATGHAADEDLKRRVAPVVPGTIVDAVLADGIVRWVHIAHGDVAAVGMAGLHDRGHINGLVVAEFIRGSTGIGKPSAVCLHCVASTLSVVLLRSSIDVAQGDELALARYRSVAELTVQVTHDFNNMMQAVLGNAALARMDLPAGSPAIASLSSIEEAATGAAGLARKLLNFAHDSARGGSTCDAAKVASDALDLAGTLYLKSVPVTKDIADRPVLVRMTDNDLENLLVLTIKSGVLQLRPVSSARLTVGADAADAQAHVLLDLDGTTQAISDEDRTESERLAAVARTQADRAGVLLGVSSEPGSIRVSLYVAREVAVQGAPPPAPAAKDGPLKGTHVLVVGAPSPLPMLLEALGCVAQAVRTWDEAAQLASSFAPRVALAVAGSEGDLQAAVLGRSRMKVPVVAVCAHGVSVPAVLSSSIDGVLGLPLQLGELRGLLEWIVSRHFVDTAR